MARSLPQPHVGDSWWDDLDFTVGTGHESNSYLFQRRVRLQLEIASQARCSGCGADGLEPPHRAYGRRCDKCGARLGHIDATDMVADVRCWLENEDLSYGPGSEKAEETLSRLVAERLTGKTLAEAAAVTFDDSPGQPTLIEDAVRAALRDWAGKFTGREERLPAFPPESEPYRPPFLRRMLGKIPFFRGLGL